MGVRSKLPVVLLSAGVVVLVGTAVSAVVRSPNLSTSFSAATVAPTTPAPVRSAVVARDPIAADIDKQQRTLRDSPRNYTAWAYLGLDYVQQAKVTVNPAYYPKADSALKRSLQLNTRDNYVAMAGQSALKAGEHNFVAARSWARRGLAIAPYNATLWGSLNDAETQLGNYDEAFKAATRMNQLRPGVPAYTRAEYVFELRGDLVGARHALQRALVEATAPADKAFVYYYLAELASGSGDPATALRHCEAGLRADPTYAALLQGKAKAEAALGMTDAAVRDYAAVVARVPQPEYVVEFGDYLLSLGRKAQAAQQYRVFAVENKLFESNGVTLDTDPTLFYANHGPKKLALQYGKIGIKIRPFIEMQDAYAWALHANGRDREALVWERKALKLGTKNALFYFHLGMIEKALGHRDAARRALTRCLSINATFSPLYAPVAQRTLSAL